MKNMFNIYYINHEKASEISMLFDNEIVEKIGSSNIEMGKKWYENIIFSFIYAIISMKVIY